LNECQGGDAVLSVHSVHDLDLFAIADATRRRCFDDELSRIDGHSDAPTGTRDFHAVDADDLAVDGPFHHHGEVGQSIL
jgi:hypothetical protein